MMSALKRTLWQTGLRRTAAWKAGKIALNDRRKRKALSGIASASGAPEQLRILVINHFFDGEIEALSGCIAGRDDVAMRCISPEPFFSRAMAWFPEPVHRAEIEYDAPELEPIRARFREYCQTLFEELASRFSFDCVLSPSDSFYWLREFIGVCQSKGIPVIIADKEGTISARSFDVEPLRIRRMFPPIADYFFVWSERQKEFWLKAGVEESRISVVGSMRTDRYVNLVHGRPDTILCYDFDTDAYINNMDWEALAWKGERNWNYLRDAMHRVMLRIARDYPGYTIVIKCHPQQVVTEFAVSELESQPNVKIIKGIPKGLPALLSGAVAVVGFQTTALLESALARTPTLYTAWGELFELVRDQILPWSNPGYGMKWIQSEEELESALRAVLDSVNGQQEFDADRSRLADYFFQADGRVTERLLAQLQALAGKR